MPAAVQVITRDFRFRLPALESIQQSPRLRPGFAQRISASPEAQPPTRNLPASVKRRARADSALLLYILLFLYILKLQSKEESVMVLTKVAREFVLHWGEMGSRWGVNRTVAQVHALLYLSLEPLTAEVVAEALAVARSNVSSSLRELQNWQLVQATHKMGDRRDFFSTSHDVWQLFLTVVQQRVEREIEPTIAALGRLATEAREEKQPEVTARIAGMHAFLQEMHGWYQQMTKLPPNSLRRLMNLGAGVTKWIPSGRRTKGEK